MLIKLLIGFPLMATCVVIHAAGLVALHRRMRVHSAGGLQGFGASVGRLISIAGWTVFLHLVQILVWAGFYTLLGAMPDFATAAYFSAVTYTTTGYGDLVLPPEWRLLGGIEALTGILMCGLSTGLFFAVFAGMLGISKDDRTNSTR